VTSVLASHLRVGSGDSACGGLAMGQHMLYTCRSSSLSRLQQRNHYLCGTPCIAGSMCQMTATAGGAMHMVR
jgi:hypothetical protein